MLFFELFPAVFMVVSAVVVLRLYFAERGQPAGADPSGPREQTALDERP